MWERDWFFSMGNVCPSKFKHWWGVLGRCQIGVSMVTLHGMGVVARRWSSAAVGSERGAKRSFGKRCVSAAARKIFDGRKRLIGGRVEGWCSDATCASPAQRNRMPRSTWRALGARALQRPLRRRSGRWIPALVSRGAVTERRDWRFRGAGYGW